MPFPVPGDESATSHDGAEKAVFLVDDICQFIWCRSPSRVRACFPPT